MKNYDNYLKLLKLAARFTDKKDFRQFAKSVNVNIKEGNTIIEATQGHICIQIVIRQDGLNPDHTENKKYTVESIEKSNKVGINLLETVEDDFTFPNLDKAVFNFVTEGSNYAQFNVYLLNTITSALSEVCKSLKVKLPRLNIDNLAHSSASILSLDLLDNVNVKIGIMPLKSDK